MKSNAKNYFISWATMLVLFNVIVFITPSKMAGLYKYNSVFWIGYAFITLTFIVQLIVTWYSFKDNIDKTFYRIPMVAISYCSMFAMLIAGLLCMVIPNFPMWLGIIICILVLAFSIIFLIIAQGAGGAVNEIDKKIKNKTLYIDSLTIEIDTLMARSRDEIITDELKKIYDAVRYSNPISYEALAGVETAITIKVKELSDSVESNDINETSALAKEIIILLNDRNKRSTLLQ